MLHELNQSACSAPKSLPRMFPNFEKVLPREQGLSEGEILPSTTQKFLEKVPAVEKRLLRAKNTSIWLNNIFVRTTEMQ